MALLLKQAALLDGMAADQNTMEAAHVLRAALGARQASHTVVSRLSSHLPYGSRRMERPLLGCLYC